LQLRLAKQLERVNWFGLGPGECYVDSREAARIGRFSASVDELYFPYIFPQDNGNRMEARWVALSNLRGSGLLAVGAPHINFSAHWHTPEDFTAARHTYDLKKRDFITLHLDHAHCGLGSASCGPAPLEPYQLKTGEFHFSVRLTPFSAESVSAAALARQPVQP
jgi:hypothetical protein